MEARAARRAGEIRWGDPNGLYVRLFSLYVRRYLRRHFHGVWLAEDGEPRPGIDGPLVVYLNHPSWWDPLLALVLARRFFADRRHVAFIDAEMAERYAVLRPLGMVGIESGSPAGARRFLEVGRQVLAERDAVLWLTPQGRFVDPRDRTVRFAGGLARLARSVPDVRFLPLALEYPFWDERTPEALARFGEAVPGDEEELEGVLERALEHSQDRLAEAALGRDPQRFVPLLAGRAGVGGVYDLWRRLRSRLGGPEFVAEHGASARSRDAVRAREHGAAGEVRGEVRS